MRQPVTEFGRRQHARPAHLCSRLMLSSNTAALVASVLPDECRATAALPPIAGVARALHQRRKSSSARPRKHGYYLPGRAWFEGPQWPSAQPAARPASSRMRAMGLAAVLLLLLAWIGALAAPDSNTTYAVLQSQFNSSERHFSYTNEAGSLSPPTYGQIKVCWGCTSLQ